MRHRVNLLDTWVDKLDLEGVGAQIDAFVQARKPHQVIAANVDFLRLGTQDPSFRVLMNSADLVLPDGMPLVWASRLLGDPLPERTSGVEIIHECSRLAAEKGYSIFLLGALPGVAEEAARVLQAHHPGLRIAGTYSPPQGPLSPDEEERTIRIIQEMQPDILFVAFGAPRQDQWIRSNLQRLGVPVCMGVGGAFDMLAGRVRRAPLWMRNRGLEWLYRLVQEPGRLWKRYFVQDLPIFMRLMAQPRTANATQPVVAILENSAAVPMDGYTQNAEPMGSGRSGIHIA